ncbi:NAD(P)-binding protein [Anaerobacillus sp. MEB173]|uniref:NAD(P)-binding protein n=1 Tax=Anaerobacillus sp. MEB173 TaxID=3383345 RepID=UPI003F8E96F9
MKKIAIVGAGISGTACAYRLEQLGFTGQLDIFDNKEGPFACNTYPELIPEILHRPISDFASYLNDQYGLTIKPACRILHSTKFLDKESNDFLTSTDNINIVEHVIYKDNDVDQHNIGK